MTGSERHLVFDVGGTQLRAAVYDPAVDDVGEVARAPAPSFTSLPGSSWDALRRRLISDLSALRSRLDPDGRIASISVAVPGPVDAKHRVLAAPPLWGTIGEYPYALEDDLRAAWRGASVRVMNDVTAAGYRYVGGPSDDVCVIAVSTGIGNKVFAAGRPLLGPSGRGGEIGHLRVDESAGAADCDCGGRGHLAALASGRALTLRAQRTAAQDPGAFERSALAAGAGAAELSAERVAAAYRDGDTWARRVVAPGSDALAFAIAAVHLAVGVERFVLIGGVALGLGERFCGDVRSGVDARVWRGAGAGVSVLLGATDGQCALVGAGRARRLGLVE